MKKDILISVAVTAGMALVWLVLTMAFSVSKFMGYLVLSLVMVSIVSSLLYLWVAVTESPQTRRTISYKTNNNALRRSA